MRMVAVLSLLVLMTTSPSSCGGEAVSVGGDYGASWLKTIPLQERFSTRGDEGGLWTWGGTPRWMNVVNGTLEPGMGGEEDELDYAGIGWLGSSLGSELTLNQSDHPVALSSLSFLYPYYSFDPWVLDEPHGGAIRASAGSYR